MNRIIAFFAKQSAIVNLVTVLVIALGLYSAFILQREAFPNVSFDTITITTVYPGAGAEETERLITNPLEQDLQEVTGIDTMTSISADNRSVIVLEIDTTQVTARDAESDVQTVIDRFTELPSGAEDPIVTLLESGRQPVVEVALSGADEDRLWDLTQQLERRLLLLDGVADVEFNGRRDREVRVAADPDLLQRYQVTLPEVQRALQLRNIDIPAGVIEAERPMEDVEVVVRTIGSFNGPDDVRNAIIRANPIGRAIRVGDVADVSMGFARAQVYYATNGEPSISVTVIKKETADTINIVRQVKSEVNAFLSRTAPDLQVRYINDTSYYIERRLSVLLNNLFVGLTLVLILLSIILPWRMALVTAIGIPFSFLATMFFFDLYGISLNLISLIGLIIVVGMIVDDAIVVVENAQARIDEGAGVEEGAILGAQQVWAPVVASVLTTMVAFMPLLYMSGIFGKVARFIPLGVLTALTFSLIESFLILPHHIAHWTRKGRDGRGTLGRLRERIDRWWKRSADFYVRYVERSIRRRYLTTLTAGLVVLVSVWLASSRMKIILFPPGGIEIFQIDIESPLGASLERTRVLVEPIERAIAQLPPEELQDYTTSIGIQQVGGILPRQETRLGQILVYLTPATERERSAAEIVAEVREKVGMPAGLESLKFEEIQTGPPVGRPVSIAVRGENYENIVPPVRRLREMLAQIEGVSDIADTYTPGKEEIHVRVRDARAAAAELTETEIGAAVRAAYEGLVATTIRTLDEEIDVRVLLNEGLRSSPETLQGVRIPNQLGNLVPLTQVAEFETAQGVAYFEHEANQRQVRVTAEVDTDVTSSQEVNALVANRLPELRESFPEVTFHFGGEAEDTQESLASLVRAFAVALAGVLLLLVILFRNFRQPLLIAGSIPLGLAAVIFTFFLHGLPLSFLGMIGMIALAGVIVNGSIVYVDFTNQARKSGENRRDSILDAARRRLRPIFLTTTTTTAGLLPTAYGIGGLDPFVVPIALSIGWGIFFGSIMVLLFLPAAIAITDDMELASRRLFHRRKLRRTRSGELRNEEPIPVH